MIKKITIAIGSKEIELTLKQANELKKDLDDLLGTKTSFLPSYIPTSPPIYEHNKVTSRPGEISYNHLTATAQ